MPDLARAVRDALAVYYFPGMWDWDRSIVQPLALDALARSFGRQRATGGAGETEPEEERAWSEELERARRILGGYFAWAPAVDRFTPIRVEADFFVPVPDPSRPGSDLVAAGEPVSYRGRIELLVVDEFDAYWLVDHRLCSGGWAELDDLLLDDTGVSHCWALELFFPGMLIAGTVYNEIRSDAFGAGATAPPPPAGRQAARAAGGHRRLYAQATRAQREVVQEGTDLFRRTIVPRSRPELDAHRAATALEILDMTDPGLRLYPSPSPATCGACVFRAPCLAMSTGGDAAELLESAYRRRSSQEEDEPGRLGAVTWSMGRGAAPPRFGDLEGSSS